MLYIQIRASLRLNPIPLFLVAELVMSTRSCLSLESRSHHASHSAHATHAAGRATCARGLRDVDDHGLGRDHQRCNTCCIDEGSPDDLGGVDNTGSLHVNVLTLAGIEASVLVSLLNKLIDNDGAFETGVLADCLSRDTASILDNANTNILVEVVAFEGVQFL